MITQELFRKLDTFDDNVRVKILDYTNNCSYPCAARVENGRVVVDIVSGLISDIGLNGLFPLTVGQLQDHLDRVQKPDAEVVLSNYTGEEAKPCCIRMDTDGVPCIDVEGLIC